MPDSPRSPRLLSQLALLLRMAGAKPVAWVTGSVAASLVLAALDTLGVAAMIPLTQLIGGTPADSGVLGWIADVVGTSDPAVLVPVLAGGIAALFVLKSVASIAFRWWLLGRTSRVQALVSTELLRRYMLSPYSAHRTRRMSEVYRNVNEATMLSTSVLLALLSLLTDIMMLSAIVVVLFLTAPVVTVLTVTLFTFLVVVLQLSLRRTQSRIGEEMAQAGLDAYSFLLPALDGFRDVRLTASTRVFVDGFRRARMRSAMAGRQLGIVAELPRYILEIGFIVAIAAIAAVLFATATPAEAVTVLGVFAAASLRGLPTLYRVSGSLATLRANRVGLRILSETVDELSASAAHVENPRSSEPYRGDIVARGVRFRYPDSDEAVLDGVSVTIPENQTTAFVGSSGAGKSTLLDLVLGLLEPTEGTIECGGRSIADDPAAWHSSLGVVPQDVFLLNDTLMANVAFGVPSERIDRQRIAQVLDTVRLGDLVAEMPDGLDTIMGERGVRLSGGQRQRLGLARALYRRPRILVLDEATSALDNVTEREITDTLTRLGGSLTIIVVAHRLSTVRDADSIVLLKDGHVEAQGAFRDLRETNRDFARLVELGDLS